MAHRSCAGRSEPMGNTSWLLKRTTVEIMAVTVVVATPAANVFRRPATWTRPPPDYLAKRRTSQSVSESSYSVLLLLRLALTRHHKPRKNYRHHDSAAASTTTTPRRASRHFFVVPPKALWQTFCCIAASVYTINAAVSAPRCAHCGVDVFCSTRF